MAVKAGFIYILTHPSNSNLIKVGVTTRDPEVRLKEHNTQFDSAAGRVVQATGQEWLIKEYFPVEDVYNAEKAFFHRHPLTELPHTLDNELLTLNRNFITWDWVNEGLEAAKISGIRNDIAQPPIPKPQKNKGTRNFISQLENSDLRPIKGYGNGVTKVAFECPQRHIFKLDARSLARFPYCPVCEPEKFDAYTLRRIELCYEEF